jgi:hypothetical protein
MYQSQVFVRSSIAWSEDQRSELVKLHHSIRRRMRQTIVGGGSKPPVLEDGGRDVSP